MVDKQETGVETIRLTIQICIVASCLVVISGDFGSLEPGFQLATKTLAMLLGLFSMAYIMLTGRKFGFKNKKDLKIRLWFYDASITFYWYIFLMMAYTFLSSLITVLFGITFTQLYIVIVMITLVIIILFYLIRKRYDNR